MVIYLILLALLCLTSVKISLGNGFNDYMSPRETGAIKGVFVIIVLLSHIRQYVHLEASPFNTPYSEFMAYLGQLMVVMFLFYSGYGSPFTFIIHILKNIARAIFNFGNIL